jgi:serine/threonine-protein kinase
MGPEADVYSLSLSLFSLFTSGQFPWPIDRKSALKKLVTSHLTETPRPMRSFDPELPDALDELVLEGLRKRPGDRPTASEFVVRLEGLVARRSPEQRAPLGGPSSPGAPHLGPEAL